MAQRILLRRGTSSQWSFYNPVLNAGEPGFDTSNQILKIGDGTTAWNDLDSYSTGGGGESTTNNYYTTFESGVYITGDQLISGEKRFDSFISGNVSGNLSGNALTVTSGVYRTGDQTIGGSKNFVGDLLVSGTNIETLVNQGGTYGDSNVATYLNGNLNTHIIPDTNSTYDIGSAEYKIRHMYLSANSLFVGDRALSKDYFDQNDLKIIDLEEKSTVKVVTSANENLPVGKDGQVVFDLTSNQPLYFLKGDWKKFNDNTTLGSSKSVDLFIIAGQSNAHGHAPVSDLTFEQAFQNGMFYTSWHDDTSNASTSQYYSNWQFSTRAKYTRGDDGNSSLGQSTQFGPELGFMNHAQALNLGTNIGIIKYAVGASTLLPGTELSDWNKSGTGDNEGDAWRGLVSSLSDATSKLTSLGYSYNFKGLIWWQGESGGDQTALQQFINDFRSHLNTEYSVSNYATFPIVITKIGYGGDWQQPVADEDPNIGIVNAALFGHGPGDGTNGSTTSNHVGVGDPSVRDFNGNQCNDMFDIGVEFASEMQKAMTVNTGGGWLPSQVQTDLLFWLDANDETSFNKDVSNVITSIIEKGKNSLSVMPVNSITSIPCDDDASVEGYAGPGLTNANIFRSDDEADELTAAVPMKEQRIHIYLVVKPTIQDGTGTFNGLFQLLASGPQQFIIQSNSSTQFFGNIYMSPTSLPSISFSTSDLTNLWNLYEVVIDPIADTIELLLNGQSVIGPTSGANITFNNDTFGLTLNDSSNPDNFEQKSDWGEVIITTNTLDQYKFQGYLAHKWGLNSLLHTDHPYKNYAPAPTGETLWTPSNITTSLWLDAYDSSTIIHTSDAVSQWLDKSGNSNHATQGTGANQPTLVASGLNGKSVLSFDGTADHLISSNFVLQNAHSIYAVAKSNTNGYRRILNIEKYYYLGNGNGNNDFATFYGSGAWNSADTNTPAKSVEAHSILVAVSDGTNAIPYHNGTAQNSLLSNMGGPAPAGITIGKHSSKSEHYWDGHIAEIIIFNENHSNTEREKVEGYLAHKWGLQSNLPSDHPYKNYAPIGQ